jgi:hypothetical protein
MLTVAECLPFTVITVALFITFLLPTTFVTDFPCYVLLLTTVLAEVCATLLLLNSRYITFCFVHSLVIGV